MIATSSLLSSSRLTDLSHLTLSSTLAELPTHSFQVSPETAGHVVATQFEKQPVLPGVIIVENSRVVGAFSRRKFLEQVSQTYGVAVYLKRPIYVMLRMVAPEYLVLSSSCPIHTAAEIALKRPSSYAYEPIIVEFPEKTFRLLDIYILLLAQSHLLTLLYQLEQNRRQFAESLQKIGQTLSSSLDLSELPKRILEELDKVVSYERGAVLLQKGDHLEIVADCGFSEEVDIRNLQIPIRDRKDDLFQRLVEARRPIRIGDVTAEWSWQQIDGLPLDRSWLGVPLVAQDRVIGMISLTRRKAYSFSSSDESLVSAFASQAAVALENARLYDHIISFNDQLEQMVNQRTEELNNAYHILEKLNQTKSDFIQVSGHELRTPLTVIKGYAQLLNVNPLIREDPNTAEMLEGIVSGVDRLYQIVNSMLDVTKIDSDSLDAQIEKLSLADIILPICGKFETALKERRLALTTSDLSRLPSVRGDPDLLTKAFYALIVNAIKYTPDGGSIAIEGQVVSPTEESFQVEIVVKDTGIGIDPAQQKLIFEKFYQTGKLAFHSSGHTKFKGGGPGLGLAIARGIIQAHDGEIWVESAGYDEENCPGSSFFVRLPVSD